MSFLGTLGSAVAVTCLQLLILLGPLAVLVVCLNLSSALVLRGALRLIGPRAFLFLFGWLGTVVHELSHALFCLIFGHRIVKIKLFDPGASDGSLGYVHHTYNPLNPYHQVGNLFIGIGPIVVGAAVLAIGALLLLGGGGILGGDVIPRASSGLAGIVIPVLQDMKAFALLLLESKRPDWLPVAIFLYIALAVGSLMHMSREDMVGALPGLAAVALLLLAGNLIAAALGGVPLTGFAWSVSRALGFGYSMMAVAVAVNLIAAMILFLFSLPGRILGRTWNPAG